MAWLPTFKSILPYVTQIVSLAVPAFTIKSGENASQEVINQQIRELQDASVRNAEAVKVLASQLQKAIADIDSGADRIGKELQRIRQLCVVAITLSAVAILLGVAALVVAH